MEYQFIKYAHIIVRVIAALNYIWEACRTKRERGRERGGGGRRERKSKAEREREGEYVSVCLLQQLTKMVKSQADPG